MVLDILIHKYTYILASRDAGKWSMALRRSSGLTVGHSFPMGYIGVQYEIMSFTGELDLVAVIISSKFHFAA